jgi:hypothetical protein
MSLPFRENWRRRWSGGSDASEDHSDKEHDMNRTQAVERVDEILDLFAEMYVSGRCPRCEALLYDADDKQLPPRTAARRRVVHQRCCGMSGSTQELARLTSRFGIRLEPVLLTRPEVDAWIVTARRADQ